MEITNKILNILPLVYCRRFINSCLLFFLISLNKSYTQSCVPDVFFHRYAGNAAIYINNNNTITNTQNETVIAGSVLNFNGVFNDATDGWITKLSARGTVLWTKQYYLPGFNSGGFGSIENATDSTYLVSGRFGKYQKRVDGSLEELDAATFIMHLDKFGNLIWLKRMTNFITNSFINNITRINNNAFIISGNIYSNGTNRILALRTDLSGNIAWYKVFHKDSTHLYSNYSMILNNGELLFSGPTMKATNNYTQFSNQGYYFLKLDASTGSINLSKLISANPGNSTSFISIYDIKNIERTVGDTLYFYTSFSGTQPFYPVPYSREAAILKITGNGNFIAATGFYNAVPGCELLDGKYETNGNHTLLTDDGYVSIKATVTFNGTVANEKAYPAVNGNLKALKLLDRSPANRILFSGRTQVPFLGLMKTESDGSISCMDGPSQMTGFDITSFFSTQSMQVTPFNTNAVLLEQFNGGIGRKNYPFTKSTDCLLTCCDNIQSDTSSVELCNAPRYQLPDNSIVKESGTYYTHWITANNCDSIAYHKVLFSQKPIVNAGADVCLGDSLQITLQVDSGYAQYNWMGSFTSSHKYNVSSPGVYSVSVTNQCGSSRDEIEVFKECDFPVYMPSGFTPNNDGLNDLFVYPPANKNHFVSLAIYNRWGQQIFFTTNAGTGWNGQYKNNIQPGDIYTYLLKVRTLNGKPILKKGIVVLIR